MKAAMTARMRSWLVRPVTSAKEVGQTAFGRTSSYLRACGVCAVVSCVRRDGNALSKGVHACPARGTANRLRDAVRRDGCLEQGNDAADPSVGDGHVQGRRTRAIGDEECFVRKITVHANGCGAALERAGDVDAQPTAHVDAERISASLGHGTDWSALISAGVVLEDPQPDRYRLDLRVAAREQLVQSGLQPESISHCPLCTVEEDALFHSWRRDQVKAVQWSGIVSQVADARI